MDQGYGDYVYYIPAIVGTMDKGLWELQTDDWGDYRPNVTGTMDQVLWGLKTKDYSDCAQKTMGTMDKGFGNQLVSWVVSQLVGVLCPVNH